MGGLKVQWKEKEGGWMRVMEVNGKGVDSLVYGHHKHGPQRSVEEAVGGGCSLLHSLTKDADFLARHGPFLYPIGQGRDFKRMGGLKWKGLKDPFHPRVRLHLVSNTQGKS